MKATSHEIKDITEEDVRQLLREKLRAARSERLVRFQKTGRAFVLVSDFDCQSTAKFQTELIEESKASKKGSASRRRLGQRILSSLEVAIVLLFILVFGSAFRQLQGLNQDTVAAWDLPTLSPTPLIQAVVLPSGHVPPNDRGETRPNEAEIPEHLRPLVQSLPSVPVTVPNPGSAHGIRIQIPAIGVDAPVVQGDGWEQLKRGVAQHLDTANPGENGNMVLSGHNDVFGEVFRDLDQLQPGDEITVFTSQRSYRYLVTGWTLVKPTQVDVMNPTPDATLTLISCYPYLIDTERIIVKAVLS
jgi:sortase A